MKSLLRPSALLCTVLLCLLLISSNYHCAATSIQPKTVAEEIQAEKEATTQPSFMKAAETSSSTASQRKSGGKKGGSGSTIHSLKKALGDKIKHIIVLMEENRSFDHVLGWYGRGDGLTGSEFNYLNPTDKTSKKYFVQKGASYVNPGDPNHSTPGTALKVFGPKQVDMGNLTDPTMCGFIYEENLIGKAYTQFEGVMDMFNTREQLPVLTALADNFVLFDRYFASVPGPTWPNRQFFMSATSNGLTETFPGFEDVTGDLFPQKTIFDQVAERNASWKIYYEDTPWEMFMESIAHNPENLHSLDQFFDDCKTGDLPHFGYINPRSGINITTGVGSNDEHPDHDVALAEAHYKRIYEAIRASPAWNETLFIITYDEHGGFYDHVGTPLNVPPPHKHMNFSYPDKFGFDRLGMRMPTLLISPWVQKGEIISSPPEAQKPFSNSEYDATSIIATVRKILPELEGLPALTDRDAWVATWEHVLEGLQTPRTDCPETLPAAPKPTLPAEEEAAKSVNNLQKEIMGFHARLHGKGSEHFSHITRQGQVAEWLREQYSAHRKNVIHWKATKKGLDAGSATNMNLTVGIRPLHGYTEPILGQQWLINEELASNVTFDGKMIFSQRVNLTANYSKSKAHYHMGYKPTLQAVSETDMPPADHGEVPQFADYCLDGNGMQQGSVLTVSACYPAADPKINRDRDQWFTLHRDATIRPFQNSSLCVTNKFWDSNKADNTLTLQPCVEGKVEQHYAYHGFDGNGFPGQLVFGDGFDFITIYENN